MGKRRGSLGDSGPQRRPLRPVSPSVRRTVVAGTYVLAGNKHLRESGWSAAAIASFAKAAYHAPDQKARHLARCFAALFGNSGRELAANVLARVEGIRKSDE